jgi:hypothetical protein
MSPKELVIQTRLFLFYFNIFLLKCQRPYSTYAMVTTSYQKLYKSRHFYLDFKLIK